MFPLPCFVSVLVSVLLKKDFDRCFFIVFFDEIHIKYESKYTEERRISKYGLDSR